jgi:membrane-associated phospholipid phosphatase
MSNGIEFRNWLLAFAATAITVALCIACFDRPAAGYFHDHLPLSAWVWIDRCLAPLKLAIPTALVSLIGCWMWTRSGRTLPRWTRMLLLCCWAAVWATLATIVLKYALGRGSPDPLFLREGLYGFRPLKGGSNWHSFPSGTAAISTAILSVLWIFLPRWRAIVLAIGALLCAAVVVTNYHWVGDVIAGVFLGALIGRITVRDPRLSSDPDRCELE